MRRVGQVARMTEEEVGVASRGQEILSVASQGDRFNFFSCVPGFQPQAFELRPAVSKELHQLHRSCSVQNVQQLEGSFTVLLYFALCTIICSHTELLNDIDKTVVISCYGLTFILY